MKEIKAYIRLSKAEAVIAALEEAGAPGCAAIEVKGVGSSAVPEEEYLSIDYVEEVSPVTKLELVCRDGDAERLVEAIRKSAYSGRKGDGMIFVSEVVRAVRIRTGETGDEALLPNTGCGRKRGLK